jgi:hypothetical protein
MEMLILQSLLGGIIDFSRLEKLLVVIGLSSFSLEQLLPLSDDDTLLGREFGISFFWWWKLA